MEEELPSYLIEEKNKTEILQVLDEKVKELEKNLKFLESSGDLNIEDEISKLNENVLALNKNIEFLNNNIEKIFTMDEKMIEKIKK